jgi:hypothetical protein
VAESPNTDLNAKNCKSVNFPEIMNNISTKGGTGPDERPVDIAVNLGSLPTTTPMINPEIIRTNDPRFIPTMTSMPPTPATAPGPTPEFSIFGWDIASQKDSTEILYRSEDGPWERLDGLSKQLAIAASQAQRENAALKAELDAERTLCTELAGQLEEIERNCSMEGFPEDAPDQVEFVGKLAKAALARHTAARATKGGAS